MNRALATTALILAMVAGVAGAATTATAFPSKTKACTSAGCHRYSSVVKITVTRVSSTRSTVRYKIKVTGGKGATGYAVLLGSKNLTHRTASTGYFKLAKGKTYKVWAVKFGTGANSKKLIVK